MKSRGLSLHYFAAMFSKSDAKGRGRFSREQSHDIARLRRPAPPATSAPRQAPLRPRGKAGAGGDCRGTMTWRKDTRATLAANAAGIWLAGGIIALLADGGAARLLSLRGAAFLLIGALAAAVLVGGGSWLIGNAMTSRLLGRFADPASADAQAALRGWRPVVTVMNIALAVLFLLCMYAAVFWYFGG
jgi:hypothetical protein